MNIWQAFVSLIADSLKLFADVIAGLGVPYSFGFAIILFTLVIKLVTLPLTIQQLRSSKAMQDMQPELAKLQKKYKNDREKLAQAQMDLYKEAGINPLGGCLPMLIQFPIWIALYRALFSLANEGVLREGFFWIPSLAEPRDLSWIWPLPTNLDGWATAAALLVLPILTVASQFIVQQMMTPSSADPQQASMNQMMKFMPIMFGFFALQVPQGLVLYWVTSNLFSLIQQYFVMRWRSEGSASTSASETSAPTKRTRKDGKQKS